MNFNKHSELEGRHSFLSASKYHWVNYSEEKLEATYRRQRAAAQGTHLHNIAALLIEQRLKLANTKQTMNRYVNDAIGFKMTPELVLRYSDNCFGTADALSFRKNLLRIHDLKTGDSPTSMTQLEIYAAIFCFEYDFKPSDIDFELRIYQNDEVFIHKPDLDTLVHIQDRIITFDRIIDRIRQEETE